MYTLIELNEPRNISRFMRSTLRLCLASMNRPVIGTNHLQRVTHPIGSIPGLQENFGNNQSALEGLVRAWNGAHRVGAHVVSSIEELTDPESPQIPSGLIGLTGPSGSGKTTFAEEIHRSSDPGGRPSKSYRSVHISVGEPAFGIGPSVANVRYATGSNHLATTTLVRYPSLTDFIVDLCVVAMHNCSVPPSQTLALLGVDPESEEADDVLTINPTSAAFNLLHGRTGYSTVLVIDSLSDLGDLVGGGAMRGGYSRELGSAINLLNSLIAVSNLLAVGIFNPMADEDGRAVIIADIFDGKSLGLIELGRSEPNPTTWALNPSPSASSGRALDDAIVRVSIRDVARGKNAVSYIYSYE